MTLTTCGAIGGSLLIISNVVASIAKRDAWMVPLATTVIGIVMLGVYRYLGIHYPDKTLIEIIESIFGKWIGLVISAGYVLLFISTAFRIPWHVSNFITIQTLTETPDYIIDFFFILATTVAVLYGLEAFARASEIFFYVVIGLFFMEMLLVAPNAKIENIFPILENGLAPVFSSLVSLSAFVTFPLVSILMIYPRHVNNPGRAGKSMFIGYLWSSSVVFVAILMSILVLGPDIASKSQFPIYHLSKEINVGMVLTRLESIITAIWIMTQMTISILYFYASVVSIAQLFKLKDHKSLIIPFGILTQVMTGVVFPSVIYQENFDSLVWPLYILTYGFILPVVMFITHLVRGKIKSMRRPSSAG